MAVIILIMLLAVKLFYPLVHPDCEGLPLILPLDFAMPLSILTLCLISSCPRNLFAVSWISAPELHASSAASIRLGTN